ncbi:MAG: hypothetical protein NUV63_11100 [Gallionella sp.]|nr:hypothetical protein [Gallionella sp.]
MSVSVEAKLKADILAAIGKTQNEDMKTVLLLTFGVLEVVISRLDAMAADEKGLREAVLNGHAENHDRDHTWIGEQIKYKDLASEEHRWVRGKIAAEKEAEKEAKLDKREARNTAIRQLVTIAMSAAAGAAGVLWMMK